MVGLAVGGLVGDVVGDVAVSEVEGGLVCVAVVVTCVMVDAVVVITTVLFPDCLLANSRRLRATTAFS